MLPSYTGPNHLYSTNPFQRQGDVLVLADAVAEFRTICMKPPKHDVDRTTRFDIKRQLLMNEDGNYELDPAHYLTAPQLSGLALLNQSRVQLELITDPEMDRMLANSKRGDISRMNGLYWKVNNK